MGSWPFIGVFVTLMLLWAGANSLIRSNGSWDPSPYTLLTLVLSMPAGLQGGDPADSGKSGRTRSALPWPSMTTRRMLRRTQTSTGTSGPARTTGK
jgi:hypothetical protein